MIGFDIPQIGYEAATIDPELCYIASVLNITVINELSTGHGWQLSCIEDEPNGLRYTTTD